MTQGAPSDILSLVEKHDRLFLTSHVRPDGDALGSEVAFASFLRKLGKQATVLNSDPPPANLEWLPGMTDVRVFDGSLAQRQCIDEAGAVFVLDTNAERRLGDLAGPVRGARGQKALIDHHTHPERWFDAQYVSVPASSTGELIYEIIAAHDPDLIDARIATALYVAIMTDTGSFRYEGVTPRLHRIVADILERGAIVPGDVHAAIFDRRPMAGLRLLGQALETVRLHCGGRVATVVVTPRMLEDTGASSEETEGFVNYALSIDGVAAALLFLETAKGTKVSFRSRGDISVDAWARVFGGGGHKNASGAFLFEPLEPVFGKVVGAAPRYVGGAGSDADAAAPDAESEAEFAALFGTKFTKR